MRVVIYGLITIVGFFSGFSARAAEDLAVDFNSNSLPSSLEVVLPAGTSSTPLFQNGQAVFPGGIGGIQRSYLRTVAKDFFSVSFVAEITISGGEQNGFFGMGVGDADASSSLNAEPRANPHIFLLMDKDSPTNNGLIDDNGLGRVPTPNVAGVGTHRVRLTWNAHSMTARFFVDRNYNEISFVPDFTSFEINGSDNAFTDSATSIFFGGSTDVGFDDFSVTIIPEPSSVILMLFGVCLILRRRVPLLARPAVPTSRDRLAII